MLVFLFALLSVFLSLLDFLKQVFLVDQTGGKALVAMALSLPSDKAFFHQSKDLHLLFYPRFSLNLRFFAFKLFFDIFVKCFWQFDCARFYSWCDYKLAIIKPSAYRLWSTYCRLIKCLIFL